MQVAPRCFAPPLTEEALDRYRELILKVRTKTELRMALDAVYACCEAWWQSPQREASRTRRGVKKAVTPLDRPTKDLLRTKLPTKADIAKCSEVFDKIDGSTDKKLRDGAFHLLWHCQELANGREPMTRQD
jgi:hypothetical protein